MISKAEAKMIEDPQEQMLKGVPIGNLMHRNWKCLRLEPFRRSKAEEELVQMSKIAEEQLGQNHPEWTRALVPMMSLGGGGHDHSHKRSKVETFERIMRPNKGREDQRQNLH